MSVQDLNIYSTGNGFIGQLYVEKEADGRLVNNNDVETIILLDVSGSMGQEVKRLVNDYIPNALKLANFDSTQTIKLVTFSDTSKVSEESIASLEASIQRSEGCTSMVPGIKNVGNIIRNSKHSSIRILTISDGEIGDKPQCLTQSNALATELKERKYAINSTAIRFYTSQYGNPDTKALACLLGLGTEHQGDTTFIVDIDSRQNREDIIVTIAQLLTDELKAASSVLSFDKIILDTPWGEPSYNINVRDGNNTFWFSKSPPQNTIKFQNSAGETTSVNIVYKDALTFENYTLVLKEKVDYFMKRLKILKVINTDTAKSEINSIVAYFEQLEKILAINDVSNSIDIVSDHGLHSRLAFFRDLAKKKSRSVSLQMAELANDQKISMLNSAQQADFLRSATLNSANARSLAKRALKQGIDFDSVAVREVKEMKKHIHELDGIDDSNHYVSFYSQETTLQGLRTVCQLDDETDLEVMSAIEILQLLNIVGIGARGPVGDFPDPKTYHLDCLMLNSFVSMSDIMIVKDSGNILRDPYGEKQEIVNVVPFYDDDRIQQFLMKYAPTLLEYTASIGMRNMLTEIQHTYKYLIVGGVWNMAIRLDSEKTSKNVDVFTKLVNTYKTASDGIFDHITKAMVEQSDEDKTAQLSFYLKNNGITNMIAPMIDIITQYPEKKKHIPAMLRALFSFEIYQSTRKIHKSDSDRIEKRKAILDQLLGIDFTKYNTPTPNMFQAYAKPPNHNRKYYIDHVLLQNLFDKMWWVDKCVLLPVFIQHSFEGEAGKNAILQHPLLNSKMMEELLGLNFDVTTFKFYCVVQSFLFDSKEARVDPAGKMKIIDCIHQKSMDDMIGEYVEKQYRANYQSELVKQEKRERNLLADELVDKLVATDNIQNYVSLLSSGLSRNHVKVVINDAHQLGFVILRDKLFNPLCPVEQRAEKLRIMVLGTTRAGQIAFNHGNCLRMSLVQLEELFNGVGQSELWKDIYEEFKAKNIYIYRGSDQPNRHSHCNSKPSYWAFGYSSIGKYFAAISQRERDEYMKIHTDCCGIADGKVVKYA